MTTEEKKSTSKERMAKFKDGKTGICFYIPTEQAKRWKLFALHGGYPTLKDMIVKVVEAEVKRIAQDIVEGKIETTPGE